MTTRLLAYYPEHDSLDNGGWFMEVDDFKDETDEAMRKVTAGLPTLETTHMTQPSGSVLLHVKAASPDGITYAEIRAAADAYLAEHNITPKPLDS